MGYCERQKCPIRREEDGLTINVTRTVEIYAQDAASGQSEDKDIVGDLGSDKVRGDGELQLHSLHLEDWQRRVSDVLQARGGNILNRRLEGHGGVWFFAYNRVDLLL